MSRTRRTPMALLAALLGAAAVLLCAAPALPQAPLRVILIDHGNVALGRKLQAEGSYAGFSFVEPSALDGSAPDAARLERAGAAAVIELASEEQVELTVASSREASARVSLVRRAGDAESFPLRVIEQLRAQLVDLGWQLPTDAEPPAAPAAPPVLPATPATSEALDAAPSPSSEPAAPRLWLKGGSSVLLAAGGVGPSAHGLLGAELQWGDVWGVGAVALLPLHQNEIRGLEGEADVSVNVFSVQASVRQPLGARWLGTAALGPGLVVLPLSADAEAPWVGKNDRLVAGLGTLELGLSRELGGWFRVSASVLTGLSAPRPVVSFAGHETAAWGRWFGALALRGEFGLPPSAEGAR